jgi:hypothetical protein
VLLPNADQAIIPPEKVRDYLLNQEHKENRGKGRVLAALGYTPSNWQRLERDLREQHLTKDAVRGRPTPGGQTYVIIALLQGPAGSANMKSIWQFDFGSEAPRLLSLYPA